MIDLARKAKRKLFQQGRELQDTALLGLDQLGDYLPGAHERTSDVVWVDLGDLVKPDGPHEQWPDHDSACCGRFCIKMG